MENGPGYYGSRSRQKEKQEKTIIQCWAVDIKEIDACTVARNIY